MKYLNLIGFIIGFSTLIFTFGNNYYIELQVINAFCTGGNFVYAFKQLINKEL